MQSHQLVLPSLTTEKVIYRTCVQRRVDVLKLAWSVCPLPCPGQWVLRAHESQVSPFLKPFWKVFPPPQAHGHFLFFPAWKEWQWEELYPLWMTLSSSVNCDHNTVSQGCPENEMRGHKVPFPEMSKDLRVVSSLVSLFRGDRKSGLLIHNLVSNSAYDCCEVTTLPFRGIGILRKYCRRD